MSRKAAILGGKRFFEEPVLFAKPTLPEYDTIEPQIREIIATGMLTKGKYLEQYEKSLCTYLESPFTLAVSNCTMGLYMLMKAFNLKGEAIVPSFSFMASFNAIENAGLTPVFVDCLRDSFTVDPKKVEEAITDKTSVIVAVNIFGNPPHLRELSEIARKHRLKLLIDSAHSFGTLYFGKPMGSQADGQSFSSSATKVLATGEGGAVTTPHREIHEYMKTFREYGNPGNYDCVMSGLNCRLGEFHAILGVNILPHLEELAQKRNNLVKLYRENLTGVPGISLQKILDGCRSSYKDFAVVVDEVQFGLTRDQLSEALAAEGVPNRRYFTPPGHLMTAYSKFHTSGAPLPNTEYLSHSVLNLPLYSHMEAETVEKIVEVIDLIYKDREEISARFCRMQKV